MGLRHELLVSTRGTDNWHLPNAATRRMLTAWVDDHEGAHRPARSRTRSRPAGRAAKPGLTGSTTRSAQVRGAEVVDRQPTLDR